VRVWHVCVPYINVTSAAAAAAAATNCMKITKFSQVVAHHELHFRDISEKELTSHVPLLIDEFAAVSLCQMW